MGPSSARSEGDELNSPACVLIVDDDADFAEGLDIVLTSHGHHVICAQNKSGAMDAVQSAAPDLALIDLRLANASGIELIAELKQAQPSLVCVVMTAFASIDSALEAIKVGAHDFLTKPIHSNQLLATLERSFEYADLQRKKKAAEDGLEQARSMFQSLIDNSPMAFNLKDVEGRFLLINKQYEEWFEVTQEEIVGKTVHDLFPKELADGYAAHDQEVLETRRPLEREHDAQFSDGTFHRVTIVKYPALDARGQLMGVGTINNDVSEARRAEDLLRQSQKMEAVGRLTGGIAHDLNNILAVIRGSAELLKGNGAKDASLRNSVLRAADRGAHLTNSLLAFARRQPLQSRPVDLGQLVGSMSELLTRTLGETIDLQIKSDPALWFVLADSTQVENAILNLALNSRDAMPTGGILKISCDNFQLEDGDVVSIPDITPGDYVMVSVSDNGVGMSVEDSQRSFEPFFTTKFEGQGTGLGLSMVYGFARQSGGTVAIDSQAGVGTTVSIYLPRTEVHRSTEERPEETAAAVGRGEVILVIENDPLVREMTLLMLKELGYQTIEASQASEARQILAGNGKVDLVLSDVILPGGMSGPQFANEVKETSPELGFLFMSGFYVNDGQPDSPLNSDAKLLRKPFSHEDLADAVRHALMS